MEELLWNILFFFIFFLIVFTFTYLNTSKKLKKNKINKITEITYLKRKFSLQLTKIEIKKMLLWISLINSFIIAFVTTFIFLLPINIFWQLMIGFVLLFALIYALYEIYGRHLVNKKERKE